MHNKLSLDRRKLMNITLDNDFSNDSLIYQLLKNKTLDSYIKILDKTKVHLKSNSIIKKGYLTAKEQFIDIVNNTIGYIDYDFFFLGKYKKIIIENIFSYKENNEYIFSKNYWGDNTHIPYFNYNIKRLVITGFYNNLKTLTTISQEINFLLKNNNIVLKKVNLNLEKDVDILYNLLKLLAICNSNNYCSIYLFSEFNTSVNKIQHMYKLNSDKSKEICLKQYITQWELFLKNYYTKKDALSCILV